ncbi:hypothetical protein OCGS_2274 [Oceaniovalibus guishaninsula JLT2003]|uniref:Uncharacterized protein n=1 Tax=Oceaniovalibus guishaninsula JLT2003 TaxID=1231392 RepID=K2HA79_9RHOB|nr:tryptophan-rich sensory protein [Oceaniovalibus guishaninsula]EKE43542.1 hypothetical protein OCGS_2274 [Oceaniovalibus guishaninsula JLT2003]
MSYLVLILTLVFAASPLVFPDFAGFDPGQYPVPQVDPPAQPAGWAFSIWGLIYAWLVVSAIYGVARRRDDPAWADIRVPLAVSLAVGTIWLGVAALSPIWATLLIWVMLIASLVAYIRAPATDRLLLMAPLGLYAGWLTAASFVALGLLAAGYGLLSPITAAWAVLVAVIVCGGLVWLARGGTAFPAAIAWASAGIAAQNWETDLGWGAVGGAAIMIGLALAGLRRT